MISVIIPIYNSERTLHRCITSVVRQTYSDLEIILVDDGSKDGSSRICHQWSKRDERIKVILKKNGGVSSARNAGIKISTGEFVLMLDSDDELVATACEMLMYYHNKEQADCIIFGYHGDRDVAPEKEQKYDSPEAFRLDFTKWLNTELLCPSWNKLYKRALIKNSYPDSISFGEDLVFVLDYFTQCRRILFIPDILYLYDTSTPNSLSRSVRTDKIYDIEYWQKRLLGFVDNRTGDSALFQKYIGDVLNFVREIYCSDTVSYKEKKRILCQWYPHSYMKQTGHAYHGSVFYSLLLFCVRNRLWFVPQVLLWSSRRLRKLKKMMF